MDDVNAGVEEHKEAGAMSKWWNGVKSSKMATAVGNNRAVQALTYVSTPRPMTQTRAVTACWQAQQQSLSSGLYLWVAILHLHTSASNRSRSCWTEGFS